MSISIITPSFNSVETISDTLNSILAQKVLPKEHIVVDGKSTDGTLEKVLNYKKVAPYEVIVISELDSGIYDAMNKGINRATGDLIGIINSDDWYENNAFDEVLKAYENFGSGIYYGCQRYLLNNQEYCIERTNFRFIGEKMIQHPTCFVHKTIYEKLGTFNHKYKYSADLELMIRFKENGISFHLLDSIIANFRIGGASSTTAAAMESTRIKYDHGYLNRMQYLKKMARLYLFQILYK